MKVLIVGLIVLALGVAGVSTYLIKSFSSEEAIEELKTEAAPVKTKVLVAGKSLKAGQTLAAGDLRWQEWPQEIVVDKYVVSEDEKQQDKIIAKHAGNVARFAITEGEPILPAKLFSRDKAGFMAGMLTPGMRAITIRVTPNSAVGGFILPNDRVDVLLVHDKLNKLISDKEKEEERLKDEQGQTAGNEVKRPPDSEAAADVLPDVSQVPGVIDVPEVRSMADLEKIRQNPSWFLHKNLGPFIFVSQTTETILRDVRVIAINESVAPPEKGQAVKANTATLEVTPKQAEMITEAQAIGKLSLVLRGIGDEGPADEAPRVATTDVEVSPLLGKFKKDFVDFNKRLAALRARQAAELERQRQAEEAAAEHAERMRLQQQMQSQAAPIAPVQPKPTVVPRKPAPKPPTLKIYRGGTAKTEEIQTK